jgi:3-hydroxyisobutyrate dehydrogenase
MAKIAYLGGGNMAQAMGARLRAAGHDLTVYNRTVEKLKPLVDKGAKTAATPREAVAGAEVVFASVTDDTASRGVWMGPHGALSADLPAGTLVVEHSTMSPDWVKELSSAAKAKGLRYVDCPVAGRPDAAAAGKLVVFGGADDKADLDAVTPYIASISRKIYHLGPVGTGTAFKLIYNLLGVVQIVGLAEALASAGAAGVDLTTAAAAFADGNTGSPHVQKHGVYMAENEHEDPPGFTANGRLKDSSYGVALEEGLGITPLVGRAAMAAYKAMVEKGMGTAADSRLFEVIAGGGKPRA